jgi:RNA recognition motif-containing protein
VTTERLYVGNLSYDATESDLFELFNGVGQVRNAEVVVNNHTQRSKGFAFVTMATVDEARRAVAELHGKDFMNRPLQVNGAKPFTKERPERGERRDRNSAAAEESQPQTEEATV